MLASNWKKKPLEKLKRIKAILSTLYKITSPWALDTGN